jgi:hypothetical protein
MGFGTAVVAVGEIGCTEWHRATVTTALHRKISGNWVQVDFVTGTWPHRIKIGSSAAGEICKKDRLYRTMVTGTAGRFGAHPMKTKYTRGVRVC